MGQFRRKHSLLKVQAAEDRDDRGVTLSLSSGEHESRDVGLPSLQYQLNSD